MVVFALVLTLAAAAVMFWAWHERVWLVNALLLRVGGDWQVQISRLDWENGALHAREMNAFHTPTAKRIADVGHIEWRPTFRQLWKQNLGGLKVEGGSVDAALALFLGASGGETSTGQPWRLESLDLAATKIVLRGEDGEPVLSVTLQGRVLGGTTTASFDSATMEAGDVMWQGKPVSNHLQIEAMTKNNRVEIKNASLRSGRVDLAWMHRWQPSLQGGMELDWQARDMVISRDGLIRGGNHELHLKHVRLQTRDQPGGVLMESLDLKVAQNENGVWQVDHGVIEGPEVDWTQALEEMLLPKETSERATAWSVHVGTFEVRNGRARLSPTELSPLSGGWKWNAKLAALDFSPEGVRSPLPQRVEVTDLALAWNPSGAKVKPPPFALLKSAEIALVPDRWRESWWVDTLKLAGLNLDFTPENGPWFDKAVAEPPKPPSKEPQPWQRVVFGELSVTDATFAMAMQLAQRMEASARFDITTKESKQRLQVQDVHVRVPKMANLPVLGLESIETVMSLPEMWSQRRVESLQVRGGQVLAGDALMTLFSGRAAMVEEKAGAVSARWTAGKVDVAGLGVTILNIAPGLPPVRFDVSFAANETPLDLDGLAENVEPQRIVLTRLRIPSPYEPLRTVAEMDVIHVNYTLDGLLHRRIDRVEIISPLLYVGEDLFWYVENYRNYIKGEAPKADTSVGPPAPQPPVAPGWRVDTLAVSDGRLLLAPKGVPLAGFGRPFPFSFTSKLESGQLDAVFDIPSDNYTLKDQKLEFRGMKGQVHFNLPIKDRNNNLTETFKLDQLRWKDLHVENAYLSVTYDVNGIYGQFGGQAYGGYLNGAFDVYLDEVYTWDGWVTGTRVDLGPVTRALFPNYLLLQGAAEVKVVATGNMHELYQGDAEFRNHTRGKLSIEALNDAIRELPPVTRGDVSQQIRRIGLETLRDFEYDKIDGKARFYGREGQGHLRFTGPQGLRNIDVNVYDHRWKEEPRKSETAVTGADGQ